LIRSSSATSGTASDCLNPPPFVVGAALVANAIPGTIFEVQCAQAELDAALNLLAGHDHASSFPSEPAGRIRTVDDSREPSSSLLSVTIPTPQAACDWVDGYARALAAVAGALPLASGIHPDPNRVVVVGALVDRLEPDALADLAELDRLLEGLGFETGASWPCGKGPDELARAAGAGILVSLPYGRDAARILAERTGASLVEAPLPLGLPGTIAFIEVVAAATGRELAAGSLVDRELARLIPDLQWLVPHSLLHRRIGVAGDAIVVNALVPFLEELGCHVMEIATTGACGDGASVSIPVLRPESMDLCIGPRPVFEASLRAGVAGFEFGFPSTGNHPIHGLPRLGFPGAAAMVEGITERMVRVTAVKDWIRMLEVDSTAIRPEEVRNRQKTGGSPADPASQQKGALGKGHS
jgi:hypothetical protein